MSALLPLALVLLGCEVASDDRAAPPPTESVTLNCGAQGYLRTELFGALAGKIDWGASDLECEGMQRPADDGARLRFAGPVDPDFKIAFIIALPDLVRGQTGKELHSKITVIEEGAGRFFSSADQDICWTDIDELLATNAAETQFEISGSLYCVAPLVEINGDSDITLGDLAFRGLLDWDAS